MRRVFACACTATALVTSASWAHAEEPKPPEASSAEAGRIEAKPGAWRSSVRAT